MRRFMCKIKDRIDDIESRLPDFDGAEWDYQHSHLEEMKAKFAYLQELDQDELDWQEALWNGDVDEDWTWDVPEEG